MLQLFSFSQLKLFLLFLNHLLNVTQMFLTKAREISQTQLQGRNSVGNTHMGVSTRCCRAWQTYLSLQCNCKVSSPHQKGTSFFSMNICAVRFFFFSLCQLFLHFFSYFCVDSIHHTTYILSTLYTPHQWVDNTLQKTSSDGASRMLALIINLNKTKMLANSRCDSITVTKCSTRQLRPLCYL